jgi:hypothetical protein
VSAVPPFENDIFISYAHIDNLPLAEGQRGWVEDFHRSLQIRLQQLLGAELNVWRDKKLQGNDYFDDTLIHRFPRIAVLVSILSPRYLQSEWCLRELREFVNAAQQTGGLRLGDRSRIFKIVKTHVPRQQHPAELQPLLGYEFYQVDQATGRPREFLLDSRDEALRDYWAKLEDVAYDIHEMLKTIRAGGAGGSAPPAPTSGKSVYVAESTSGLEPPRSAICRELRQRGHRVLPDRPLPLEGRALRQAIRESLADVDLSIHLVGSTYAIVPEGESTSIEAIQLELAGDAAGAAPRPRVVWLPPDLTPGDERQRALVASVRDEYAGRPGVEVLQTPLEELKTFVHDRLTRAAPARPPAASASRRRVYLVCDGREVDAVRPIEDHLYGLGFEVVLPATEGDEGQLRQDHQANLVECDAVLVFYGQGSEIWLRAKLRDLDKAPGYGRAAAFAAKAVYVAAPATPAKERFRTHDARVIRNFGPFSANDLAEFVADLGGAGTS